VQPPGRDNGGLTWENACQPSISSVDPGLEGRFAQVANLRMPRSEAVRVCPWMTAGDRSFPLVLARTWAQEILSLDILIGNNSIGLTRNRRIDGNY
jgi:hypothetical protein